MDGPQQQFTNALLVVAKRPAPGRTKTRLVPPLSPEQAAALYECFLRDTFDLIRQVPQVQPVVAFLPAEEEDYFAKLVPDFGRILQTGASLGVRLDNALNHYLQQGYRQVVIMNSDGPTLPPSYLTAAFDALADGADAVLGPCNDGGYYLIGVKQPVPRLLREVQMSTPQVTAETLRLAAEEGLQMELLPVWYDVDNAQALVRLIDELAASPGVAHHTRAFLQAQQDLLPALRG